MNRIAIYPGTFDPVTLGHMDIIRRSRNIIDKLFVAVARNPAKAPLFSAKERVAMLKEEIHAGGFQDRISVITFSGLLVELAHQMQATILIRGLRAVSDFEYEFQMVGMNAHLDNQIETVFLMADIRYQPIAAHLVKEIASLGGDVSKFVPATVIHHLNRKYGVTFSPRVIEI